MTRAALRNLPARFKAWRSGAGKDSVLAGVSVLVFALFFVLGTRAHRDLFYLLYLLPAVLLYRPADFREVVSLRLWQVSTAFISLWALSTLWAVRQEAYAGLDELRVAVILLIFITLTFRLALREALTLSFMFRWVMPVAAVSGLAAIIYALGVDRGPMERIEGFGRTNHPIIGASIYAATMIVAVVSAGDKGNPWGWRLGCAGVAAICAGFIVLSESRGPLLALLVAFTVMACFRRRSAVLLGGAGVAAALLILVLTGAVDLWDWVERGASYRLALWEEALQLWAQRPFLGYGAATGHVLTAGDLTYRSPHNVFLATGYYTGLVGLILMLWLVGLGLAAAFRQARAGEPVYLALMTFAIVAMGLDTRTIVINLDREWFIFWLPLILASAARGKNLDIETARQRPE